MLLIIFYIISSILILFILYKPFRHYCLSYFFPYLYEHPKLANFFGIEFKSDEDWATNRDDTKIYIPGVFGFLFTKFTGLPIESSPETIKEILRLQGAHAKKITMKPYLKDIIGKTMTLTEFETYLSDCILTETNRVFELVDSETETEFRNHLKIVREIITGLTCNPNESVKSFFRNFSGVRKIIAILNKLSSGRRLILLIPHLSLIDGFSKMLVKKQGNLSDLQMSDFFDFTSRFFVFLHKGNLVFVKRHIDTTNNSNNRVFGLTKTDYPTKQKMFCPGSIFVSNFIKSILSFLKTMNIEVNNVCSETTISNERFRNIIDKNKIQISFKESERNYSNNNEEIEETEETDYLKN